MRRNTYFCSGFILKAAVLNLTIFYSNKTYLNTIKATLCKIPKFHLIPWCGNFVERHSFSLLFYKKTILILKFLKNSSMLCFIVILCLKLITSLIVHSNFCSDNNYELVSVKILPIISNMIIDRSSQRRCFFKKGVLKNFAKFTEEKLQYQVIRAWLVELLICLYSL